MKTRIFLSAFVVLLVSCGCIDLTTELTINDNETGEVTLIYSVSQMVVYLGMLETQSQLLPIPITENDFRSSIEEIDGLELRSFTWQEDDESVRVEAVIRFESLEALNGLLSSEEKLVAFTINEDGTTLTYIISEANQSDIDSRSKDFMQTFFQDNTLDFTVNTPQDIQAISQGELESDRRAHLTLTIPEILASNERIAWDVTW